MKKYFSLLLLLFSLSAFAQKEDKVVFNFNDCSSLSPKLAAVDKEKLPSYDILDSVFTADHIKLTLSSENSYPGAVQFGYKGTMDTKLIVYRQGKINVSSDIHYIKTIEFKGDQGIGLNGGISTSFMFGVWSDEAYKDNTLGYAYPVNSVWFKGSNTPALYDQVIVTYYVTQDILAPLSTSIDNGGVVKEFSSFEMSFEDEVKIQEGAIFKLVDIDDNEYPLTAKVSDKVVTLSVSEAINTPGEYKIIFGANSIITPDDKYYNKDFSLNFTIKEPTNNFDIVSTEPATGEVEFIPTAIKATFEGSVGGVDNSTLASLYDNETNDLVARFSASRTALKEVTFSTEFPINDKGVYKFVIPEGMVYNINYSSADADHGISKGAKCNPETVIMFYVGTEAPEPEPEPEPEPDPVASDSILAVADSLLAFTGAGYPAEDAAARLAIKALQENIEATDTQYEEAFKAFYQSTEIALPADTTYRIANVAKDGSKLYLSYADGQIGLTENVEEACIFDATTKDGKTLFLTEDSLYLHTLVKGSDLYEGTTDANVTKDSTSICNITISKLEVEGIDAKDVFGYVTLFGEIGEKNGVMKSAYSLINTETKSIVLDDDANIFFTDKLSSAFVLEPKERPYVPFYTDIMTTPTDKGSVDCLDYVLVSFPEVENVVYTEDPVVYLMLGTDSIAPIKVEPSDGKTNQFAVRFMNLEKGTYQFYMPKGAFMCGEDTIQAHSITINVTTGYGFKADMSSLLVVGANISRQSICLSAEVNGLSLYDKEWKTLPYISKDAKVELHPARTKDWKEDILATGTLKAGKAYDEPRLITNPDTHEDEWYTEEVDVLNIEFDKKFEGNDLRPTIDSDDSYVIIIYEGSYGDAYYAQYMADPTSVKKEQCHVNKQYTLSLRVQRTEAVDINTIATDNVQNDVIYDLTGRRVTEITKGGIYIINGKKKYIK